MDTRSTTAGLGPLGAHVPVAGGLARTGLARAAAIGASCVQVFVANPRGWAQRDGDPGQDDAFRRACAERDIQVIVHAPYLVNLGSPDQLTAQRSVSALRHSLRRGTEIGAAAVVFHAGSAVGADRCGQALGQLRQLLLPLLEEADAATAPRLLVEPTAGGGRALAATVADLGPFLAAVDHHPRLGVCLDTCHLLAAGEDIATPGGATATVDRLLAVCGPGRLAAIHANDSKDPLGSDIPGRCVSSSKVLVAV